MTCAPEQCYFELGQALKTLDVTVEINNLFHQTLRGLLLLECSLLNPTEQAAILATTINALDYYLVKIAMFDQWPDVRLFARDGLGRQEANAVDYGYGFDYSDDADGFQETEYYDDADSGGSAGVGWTTLGRKKPTTNRRCLRSRTTRAPTRLTMERTEQNRS